MNDFFIPSSTPNARNRLAKNRQHILAGNFEGRFYFFFIQNVQFFGELFQLFTSDQRTVRNSSQIVQIHYHLRIIIHIVDTLIAC